MSTTVLDHEKLRLSQVQLALNGWVGPLPTLSVKASGPLETNRQNAAANEGQALPASELGQHQD